MTSIQPSTWPLLLCGPILRRVDNDSVSVFVVLKYRRKVKLSLYEGNSRSIAPFHEHEEETIALGRFLHVKVVTAKNLALQPGITYGYNLTFTRLVPVDPTDSGSEREDLDSLRLLNGERGMLGYQIGKLPSFALPPNDINFLRLIHASCRMAHGEGVDISPTLDTIIRLTHNDPLRRPHQLFLTGDQIYADDVEDSVLRLAGDVGDELLSWPTREPIPGVIDNGTVDTRDFALAPSRRMKLLGERKAGFTSEESGSHLISLAEFYGIYLLVWSDVAWWPRRGSVPELPSAETVFDHPGWRDHEAERRKALNKFQTRYIRASFFMDQVSNFRRALANVPTYMIFDDHEVTDDWYIYKKWVDDTHRSPLGLRILQNALSAYAVFQAWGNDPEQFTPDRPGGKLLFELSAWKGDEDEHAERIRKLLDLPSTSSETDKLVWDYAIDAGNYQVIVLDTRTHREYPPGNRRRAPGLMSSDEMQRQITDRLNINRNFALTVLISPVPIFGHSFVEDSLFPFLVNVSFGQLRTFIDYESWVYHPARFQELLSRLVPFRQVLILSGDVHYGLTASIEYWLHLNPNDPSNEQRARFVQCISSGLKREDGIHRALARGARVSEVTIIPPKSPSNKSFLGWSMPGDHISHARLGPLFMPGPPAILEVPYGGGAFVLLDEPQWRFRITFQSDSRGESARGTPPFVVPPLPPPPAQKNLDIYYKLALRHRKAHKLEQMREVVGHNNLGEITFAWTATGQRARQALWFNLDPGDGTRPAARPYTVCDIPFLVPTETDPRPSLTRL